MTRPITLLLLPIFAFSQNLEKRITPIDKTQQQTFEQQRKVGVAILVGVGRYPRYSGLSELRYPGRDVELIEQELARQRYVVISLRDGEATKGAVLNAIRQAGEVVDHQNGTLIFFFSGHGFADQSANFLATFDAASDSLAKSGLSLTAVEKELVSAGAPRRIMWIDACRNEPGKGAAEARSFTRFAASAGTRVLFSTKAGRISYEDDEFQQGIFSHYLVQGLRGEAKRDDGLITFRDLADYVTDAVQSRSLKQGRVQIPYEAGESSGDFLLARSIGSRDEVATAPPVSNTVASPPMGSATDAEKLRLEAEVLHRNKRDKEALALLDRAIQLTPDFAAARVDRASIYFKQSQNDRALRELDEAQRIDPNFIAARAERGGIFQKLGRTEEANKEFQSAVRMPVDAGPGPLYYQYEARGFAATKLNRFDDAIEDFTVGLRLRPDDPELYELRGAAYLLFGKYPESIQDLTASINFNPEETIYTARGEAYLYTKQYQRSIQDFSEALRLNPDNPDARAGRAVAFEELNSLDQALQDFEEGIRRNPGNANLYRLRGEYLSRVPNWPRAVSDLEQAVRLDSGSVKSLNDLAQAYMLTQRWQEASNVFQEILRKNGKIQIPVLYDRGNQQGCQSMLEFSRGTIAFAGCGGSNGFSLRKSELLSYAANALVWAQAGGFNIKFRNSGSRIETYNFAPVDQNPNSGGLIVWLIGQI